MLNGFFKTTITIIGQVTLEGDRVPSGESAARWHAMIGDVGHKKLDGVRRTGAKRDTENGRRYIGPPKRLNLASECKIRDSVGPVSLGCVSIR
jgi:hypothetical protein